MSNHTKKYTEEYGESEWDGFASNANWLSGVNLVAGPDFQNEIDVSLAQLKAKLAANGGGDPNLTNQFNQRVSQMQAFFGLLGNTYNDMYGGHLLSYPQKFITFGYTI